MVSKNTFRISGIRGLDQTKDIEMSYIWEWNKGQTRDGIRTGIGGRSERTASCSDLSSPQPLLPTSHTCLSFRSNILKYIH